MIARTIPVVLVLALSACGQPRHAPTTAALSDRSFDRVVLFDDPWWFGGCGWSEPYSAQFTAAHDGSRWSGVVCSMDEAATTVRLVSVRRIAWATPWP